MSSIVDQNGQPIRFGATVTYSAENGRKIKTEVFEPKTPGVDRALGFEDSPSQATFWSTGNAAVAATFFEKSGEINLADPNPSIWEKIWFFDHPTRPERVRFAASYDPWGKSKGPEYVK